jgi:hypothetical protein
MDARYRAEDLVSALIQHSSWLRRLAIAYPSAVPRPLLHRIGVAGAAAVGGDEAPARGSAVWLGWDAWVSPIDGDRARIPSPNPGLILRRRTS